MAPWTSFWLMVGLGLAEAALANPVGFSIFVAVGLAQAWIRSDIRSYWMLGK